MNNNGLINQSRLINTFIQLGKIDGIHGNEIEIAGNLLSRLKELGLSASMDDAGKTFGGNAGNIIARLPGNVDAKSIFLCAHMDTIQSTKNLKHVLKDDIIASDGTTILGGDNRAGLAVILEILQILNEKSMQHGPIEVLFNVCEEAGMYGAKYLKREDLISEFGFVFDCQASPGAYIIEAPGAYSFTAKFIGKSAHAAVSPEKGINAIQMACTAISQLKLGRWDKTGMLNIGKIEGGISINVIPDKVELTGETRNANKEKLKMQIDYIRNIFEKTAAEFGGEVDLKFVEKYGGYQFTEDAPVIITARRGISAAGYEPNPISYPGGSDANVLNNKGITALNLGVGFKNAHSFNEYISVHDLTASAEIGLNVLLQCVLVDQVEQELL
jgi:tripeptide aminopeptidase